MSEPILSASPSRSLHPAADDELLAFADLHLDPVGTPTTSPVGAVQALGHDTFEVTFAGQGQELASSVLVVRWDSPGRAVGDQIDQKAAPLVIGKIDQGCALEVEKIEHDEDRWMVPQQGWSGIFGVDAMLEASEGRPVAIEDDKLAIEHDIGTDGCSERRQFRDMCRDIAT